MVQEKNAAQKRAAQRQEWMNRHEPDKGNSLNVVRHRLVKREWTEWVTY